MSFDVGTSTSKKTKSDYVPTVNVSEKTNKGIAEFAQAQNMEKVTELSQRLNSTKELAQEMLDKLQGAKVMSGSPIVDVHYYTDKEGVEKLSSTIKFSVKESDANKKQEMTLSVNGDKKVTFTDFKSYDISANKYSKLNYNEVNDRLKDVNAKLGEFGYVKVFESKDKTPFDKTVSAFHSAVKLYNKEHKGESNIVWGSVVKDENGNRVMGENGYPVREDVAKFVTEDGRELLSLNMYFPKDNESLKINLDKDGNVTSANYYNNETKESSYTYDLNRWTKDEKSFISEIFNNTLGKIDYKAPERPEKSEGKGEGFQDIDKDVEEELPFR